MLTGKQAFDGDDVVVVLASIIKSGPNWSALLDDVPPPVVTLLRGCLEKDPRSRIGHIAAALFVLSQAAKFVGRKIPLADGAAVIPRPQCGVA